MEKTKRPAHRILRTRNLGNLPLAALCACGLILSAFLWACQITGDKKTDTANFDQMYDKLSQYDSVVIVFKDGDGNFLDTVFAGKVDSHAKIQDLPVKGWDGGKARILISGFNGGTLVYQIEKKFDGSNNQVDANILLRDPTSALSGDVRNLAMREGDSLPLPRITVTPDNLSDKGLLWRVSDTVLLLLGPDYIQARSSGSATLTAKLQSDSSKTFAIQIVISGKGGVKDTTPPNKPLVQGPAISNTAQPTWTWTSGGGGGAGVYRINLDIDSFPKPEILETSYTPTVGLSDGLHTLYVQERDSSGNWSASGKSSILISVPLPGAPKVQVTPSGITNNAKPIWSWSGLGGSGFQFRLDSNSFVGMTTTVTDTTFTPPAPLSDGLHTLYVREKKSSDTWSPVGYASVTVDLTPPLPPQVHGTSPSSVVPTWTWSGGGGAGIFRYRLADSLFTASDKETTDASYTVASATSGTTYTLYVQERDLAGNWSGSGKLSILFLPPQPGAPKVQVNPSGTTNNAKPVWSWSGSGGSGFQFRLDSNSFVGMTTTVTDTTFTPSAPLYEGPHTLYVREKNSAGAWSATGSASVTVDLTPPYPPKVFGTSPTNLMPSWSWTGGGGAGIFRYRLGDSLFTASDKETTDLTYTLTSATSGSIYTLYVEERDQAGNWSGLGSKTILYDLTQPVVSILSPQASGTYYTSSNVTLSGTATGPQPISKVTYRIGTGTPSNATFTAPNWSIPVMVLPEGVLTQVTVSAVDNLGNSGDASLGLFLDATPPSVPTLTTVPAASISILKATFGWNPGGDGANGSGLNGHYRYNVNGGAWKDTTAALLLDLPLHEGNNIFNVQEQDKALLWSASAARSVIVDTTAPVITLTSPATNPATITSLNVTLSGQVKDTGMGVASMAISGQASGSGTITVTGTTWTTASLTLNGGANALRITATDQVGNSRILPVQITVNVPAPKVSITIPSDSLTITALDTIRVYYTIDGAAGNKLFNLPKDSVYRLEIASPPNASGNIGRDTVKVTRDATPPKSPTLSSGRTPTNDSATWTWTSNGDNPGGAGVRSPNVFRYSLNNGSTWTVTTQTRYKATAEGSYTLIVQEEDKAGNWSASSQEQTIVVDKTPPSVTITTRNNYVTNRSKVLIYYKVDNVDVTTPVVCTLTQADQSNTCSATATDNAGNVGSASITVWYRPNTWFFTANGTGNGTSWDSAASDLNILKNPGMDGKELWFATGQYKYLPLTVSYTLLGGFDASSLPYTSTNRNKIGTIFNGNQNIGAPNTRIDGAIIKGNLYSSMDNLELDDVQVSPPDTQAVGMSIQGSAVFNNLILSGNTFNGSAIMVQTGPVTFNGGSITNNMAGDHWWAIQVSNATVNLKGILVVSGNATPSDPYPAQVAIQSGGVLNVGPSVTLYCRDRNTAGVGDVEVDDGTLNCNVP